MRTKKNSVDIDSAFYTQKKRNILETTKTVYENGDVSTHVNVRQMSISRGQLFIKVFYENIGYFKIGSLPMSLLLYMYSESKFINENTPHQIFYLNTLSTQELCLLLNCKKSNMQKALKKVISAGIAFRVSRGVYILNPYFAAKGSASKILKSQESFTCYEQDGRYTWEFAPTDSDYYGEEVQDNAEEQEN